MKLLRLISALGGAALFWGIVTSANAATLSPVALKPLAMASESIAVQVHHRHHRHQRHHRHHRRFYGYGFGLPFIAVGRGFHYGHHGHHGHHGGFGHGGHHGHH